MPRKVDAAANEFSGSQTSNRLVITIGKFAVTDIFDTNKYAHDPHSDFMNWSLLDTGTFDYAADAWGFTCGAAAEWYQGDWTVRGGVFDLSVVPNSTELRDRADTARLSPARGGYAHATTCGVNKNNRPASSIVISPFEQRLRAAAQCFCCNYKAARLAFECLHLTSIGARPRSHKHHSLAAARASDVLVVMHWNMSPSRNSQGGPLGPETSPSGGTLGNNRAN